MVLPLNLAMTPSEVGSSVTFPNRIAWMACRFSDTSEGLTDLPQQLPEGAMLILDDSQSCAGHDPELIAQQLTDTVAQCGCESVLLDFQRPYDENTAAMAKAILSALPCPVAVTEHYAKDLTCPVFLAPCPLHMTLQQYLQPWKDREIWMEAALCQERAIVTKTGTSFIPLEVAPEYTDGFYNEALCCRYRTAVSDDRIAFTLFDTVETLRDKMARAMELGVSRFVGIYQELASL